MGDISKTGDKVEGTLSSYYNGIGLYGLDANSRSFGLNVNGKAFFGKAGRGQILIDGNKGTITSALFETEKRGLKLDLDDGTIEARGFKRASGQVKILIDPTVESTEAKPYFQVQADNKVNLLYFGPQDQHIASYDYNKNAHQGTIFDLTNGHITSYSNDKSFVRLSSGKSNSKKFFEIYDGVAQQTIFMATGATDFNTTEPGPKSYTEFSSESLADINAVNTYLTNCIKNVNVNGGTVEGDYPKITWSVNYRILRKETKNKVTTEYYKFVVFKDETTCLKYSGESVLHPVTNRPEGQEQLVGDITASSTDITVFHTVRKRYTATIPMADIKGYLNKTAIKNIDANVAAYVNSATTIDKLKDECFIYLVQTANAIPTSLYTVEDVPFDYNCSNTTRYTQVVELTGLYNGNYYLQSSNYNGKTSGLKLDLSNGTFATYSGDGSYVRIKGTGDPFFEIYDKYGANVSNGQLTGKSIFYAKKSMNGENGSYFLQSSNYQTGGGTKIGTKLDLSKGQYLSYGTHGRIEMKPEESVFFKLSTNETDGSSKTLMVVQQNPDDDGDGTSGQYYLQSVDFNATGHTGTRLDLQHGKYISYGSYGRVTINSNGSTVFKIDYRSGAGDINFVNLVTIGENAYWIRSIDYAKPEMQKGSCWNLYNGTFETYNTAGAIRMTPTSDSGLFQVIGKPDGGPEKILMNVGNSNYYLQSAQYPDGTSGSYWNLQNGNFETKNTGGKILMQPSNANALFQVSGYSEGVEKVLMNVGSNSYFLQSANYSSTDGFYLDLSNGNMVGHNFFIYLTNSSGYIKFGERGSVNAIDVNGKFIVQWDGDTYLKDTAALYVQSGKICSGTKGAIDEGKYYSFTQDGGSIAGWKIGEKNIYNQDDPDAIQISSEGTVNMKAGNNYMSLSTNGFTIGESVDLGVVNFASVQITPGSVKVQDGSDLGRPGSVATGYYLAGGINGYNWGNINIDFYGGPYGAGKFRASATEVQLYCYSGYSSLEMGNSVTLEATSSEQGWLTLKGNKVYVSGEFYINGNLFTDILEDFAYSKDEVDNLIEQVKNWWQDTPEVEE
jgi:hypothetical protein